MILTILKRIKKDCLVKTAAGQGTKHIISYLTAGRGTAQSRSPWTWWCSPVGSCLTPTTSSQSSPTWDPAGRWLTTINSTRFSKNGKYMFLNSHANAHQPCYMNNPGSDKSSATTDCWSMGTCLWCVQDRGGWDKVGWFIGPESDHCLALTVTNWTRPSVNYAKDWLNHSFLFPGLVWSEKEFHFGCDH